MSHLQNKNEEDLEKVRKGAPRAQVQVSEAIRQLRSEISRILQKRRVASLTQSLTISFPCFLLWSLGLAPRPWQASWLPLLCPLTHFVMLFMPSDTSHVNPDWNMSSLLWHLQNSITTMSSSTGASNLLWRGKNQEVFLLSVSRVTCTGVGSRWVDFVLFHSLLSIESNFESTACWKKGKVSWSPRIHTHMFIRYVY